jgi:hypothetical protein
MAAPHLAVKGVTIALAAQIHKNSEMMLYTAKGT